MRLRSLLRLHLVALLIAFAFIQGCEVLSHDNREKIAKATLLDEKGMLSEKVLVAALSEKFAQPNSSSASFEAFIQSLGGNCTVDSKDKNLLYCSLSQASTICVDSRIDFSVITHNGNIVKISGKNAIRAC